MTAVAGRLNNEYQQGSLSSTCPTFQPLEGGDVDLGDLVVVELEGGEVGQPVEVARAQRGQQVVVQREEVQLLQT